jgi:hypothetical protein
MPMPPAAVGFRAHSGWAAVVAVAGPGNSPGVIVRRRIELADPDLPGSLQPYHAGEGQPLQVAERFVAQCTERTAELALQAMRALVNELRSHGHDPVGCGMLTGSDRPPGTVGEILASHPWMHAAEGQFFRTALLEAAERCELRLLTLPERHAYAIGAAHFARTEASLREALKDMGRTVGSPWRQDHKLAALAAWMSLSPL